MMSHWLDQKFAEVSSRLYQTEHICIAFLDKICIHNKGLKIIRRLFMHYSYLKNVYHRYITVFEINISGILDVQRIL